jgi:uncharacterized membrane protein
MNVTGAALPVAWYWLALPVLGGLLVHAVLGAPWRRLRDPSVLNAWLGSIVALFVLWTIRAQVQPGLAFHLLGATATTLMFGPRLALVALSLVAVATAVSGGIEPLTVPLNLLILAAVPIAVTRVVMRGTGHWLPRHLFVYIFGNAFFGAALAMFATGLAAGALLAAGGRAGGPGPDYLLSCFLLSSAEAFMTGGAITLLVVYRPGWVTTFDDTRYLGNHSSARHP